MQRSAVIALILFSVLLALPMRAQSADLENRLKGFSDFQQVDLNRLLAGEVLAERGSLMNCPNGISVQTCFFVPIPPEEASQKLQLWDPSRHEALKVFAHQPVHEPVEADDFKALSFKADRSSVRWLMNKTLATTAGKSLLNLSRSESQQIASALPKGAAAGEVALAWANLLQARVQLFQTKGLDGVAPYEVAGEVVSPADQLRTMLREQTPITREFAPILEKSGVLGARSPFALPSFHYWDLFDADGHATISLGTVYRLAVEDRFLLLDMEHYVSNGYYTSAVIYEVWPVQSAGKSGSVIWRGDYFAAPTLAYTKGIERIAYGAIMLLDIKKADRFFQEDVKGR